MCSYEDQRVAEQKDAEDGASRQVIENIEQIYGCIKRGHAASERRIQRIWGVRWRQIIGCGPYARKKPEEKGITQLAEHTERLLHFSATYELKGKKIQIRLVLFSCKYSNQP